MTDSRWKIYRVRDLKGRKLKKPAMVASGIRGTSATDALEKFVRDMKGYYRADQLHVEAMK